jgi:hypothetical protein
VGVDLVEPPEIPDNCEFIKADILRLAFWGVSIYDGDDSLGDFDFIVASSPCEQFSVHGMKHFHPNPPYPELGIKLFNHTRQLCEAAGVPYVMENVRAAQQFVGNARIVCGPFALWGSGVPPLIPQGITKGFGAWDRKYILTTGSSKSKRRAELKAKWATIPPELANCVADYAERILEAKCCPTT